jgi:hypothetical protein
MATSTGNGILAFASSKFELKSPWQQANIPDAASWAPSDPVGCPGQCDMEATEARG